MSMNDKNSIKLKEYILDEFIINKIKVQLTDIDIIQLGWDLSLEQQYSDKYWIKSSLLDRIIKIINNHERLNQPHAKI